VQIIAGANYPTVPPGLIIVLVAATLVLFLPWRWAPLIGVLIGGFLFFGGVKAAGSRYDLTHPGHPGVFVGIWIEMLALAVAVIAGIAALTIANRRPAQSW
jgi:hypothetical protein